MPKRQRQPAEIDVTRTLHQLSLRVRDETGILLPKYVWNTLAPVIDQLRLGFPGLDLPTDQATADKFRNSAIRAKDKHYLALSRTLMGLAKSKYDPRLWHLASTLCFKLGHIEATWEMLCLTTPRQAPRAWHWGPRAVWAMARFAQYR
jgi:hypothetical protein